MREWGIYIGGRVVKNDIIPFLRPTVYMTKTNKGAVVKYENSGKAIYINQSEALFLKLCDGTRNIENIINIFFEVYEVEKEILYNDLMFLIEKYKDVNILMLLPQKIYSSTEENYHEYIFIHEENAGPIIPQGISNICFEITNYCSLNCNYCYGLYNKNNNNFLPIKKVIEVLEQAKEMQKVSYVAVTGGDPIEHPDLPELIKYLEQNNIFMIYLQKL